MQEATGTHSLETMLLISSTLILAVRYVWISRCCNGSRISAGADRWRRTTPAHVIDVLLLDRSE